MAAKLSAFLAIFLAFCAIIIFTGTAMAIRGIPTKAPDTGDTKHPDCDADDGLLIPGISRYMKPHARFWTRIPLPGIGGFRDIGGGYQTPRYVPGFDDTSIPNPGFEIPIFGGGAHVGNYQP